MSYRIVFGLLFMSTNIVYAQCDYSSELSCNLNEDCEWVENLEIENCYDILDCTSGCTWQDCEEIEGCSWHFGTAYYDPSYCYGEHEGDNSYCQEVQFLECSEMNEIQCNADSTCAWYDDIDSVSCGSLSASECNQYFDDGCSLDADCVQWGSWYTWICYEYGPSYCTGGTYEIDNGSCEEIEMPDCSELEQASCNHPLYGEGCEWIESDIDCEFLNTESSCDSYDCEWVEDISQGNCFYAFSSYSECVANGCSWYNPGTYGYMGSHCYGGNYTIDNLSLIHI